MRVRELSESQLIELKQSYVCEMLSENGESVSYGELANAETIDDEVIFDYYDGYFFVEEDFCCTL